MPVMTTVPADSPLMKAWESYKATPEYQNTREWALHDEHVDGSLWAAFCAGRHSLESVRSEALRKAADTFRDLSGVLQLLGRPVSARACEIAEEGCRAALSPARVAEDIDLMSEIKKRLTGTPLPESPAKEQPGEQRWIPVSERLPKKPGAYVVLSGKYHALLVSNWDEANGGFRWTDYAYITHWLDGLPPPPERP